MTGSDAYVSFRRLLFSVSTGLGTGFSATSLCDSEPGTASGTRLISRLSFIALVEQQTLATIIRLKYRRLIPTGTRAVKVVVCTHVVDESASIPIRFFEAITRH